MTTKFIPPPKSVIPHEYLEVFGLNLSPLILIFIFLIKFLVEQVIAVKN